MKGTRFFFIWDTRYPGSGIIERGEGESEKGEEQKGCRERVSQLL